MLYCIGHEKMVEEVPLDFCPMGHNQDMVSDYDGVVVVELDFCCFEKGYATCPPPALFMTRGRINAPDAEEIEHLDSVASEMLTGWS